MCARARVRGREGGGGQGGGARLCVFCSDSYIVSGYSQTNSSSKTLINNDMVKICD